ncbi:MAG TPA: hypothetical protein VFS05_10005 [Gemmatimonadaceae bacterium]|nr:hypothetical protein [Gemmatimonadaceae bacterium]
MEWQEPGGGDAIDSIDAAARAAIGEYAGRLRLAGLRATYDGVTAREEVPGMRESEVQLWFWRGSELVDQVEVPVERPGLEPATPAEVGARLRAALHELVGLHAPAASAIAARPIPWPAPWSDEADDDEEEAWSSPYAQRLQTLTTKVLLIPAAALAVMAFVGGIVQGAGIETFLWSLWGLVGTYVFAFPTAAVASVVHTHLARALGEETERASTLLGVGIGLVAGACTPWFLPVVEPWPVEPLAALSLLGGVTGAAYGALVARRNPLAALPAPGTALPDGRADAARRLPPGADQPG